MPDPTLSAYQQLQAEHLAVLAALRQTQAALRGERRLALIVFVGGMLTLLVWTLLPGACP
jgi:hypothetical protein